MPPVTDEEYHHTAEVFVDALLDPRKPWLTRWVLHKKSFYKFLPIPTWAQIEDGTLAGAIYQGWVGDILIDERFHNAVTDKDRATLVRWFAEEARERKLTKDELLRLLAITDIKTIKRSLKGLAEPFKFQPGPSPPTRGQYDAALECASALQIPLLRFLQQKSSGTKNTTLEILRFISKDFPKECKFLVANLAALEACFRDRHLRERAKTIRSRSRILADAVAGSVHLNRKPSTAAEYLATERRLRRKTITDLR
jgi:hypothetical protein